MNKSISNTDQRLIRIEEMLTRLEWRMEQNEAYRRSYSSDSKRYCLENDIDMSFFYAKDMSNEYADKEFLEGVDKWFQENENDSSITFNQLEHKFGGKSGRLKLVSVLKAFYLHGYWQEMIEKISAESSGCPAEAKGITRDPYKDEKL